MKKEQKTIFITAGELAKKAGVTTRTLRFYDKKGLLVPAGTGAGNVRYYTEKEVERLNEIMCYKMIGLSLEEIAKRLEKGSSPSEIAEDIHAKVLEMEEIISKQMKQYSIMRNIEALSGDRKGADSWGALVEVMDYVKVKWDLIWQINEAYEKDRSLPENPEAADEKMKQYYKLLTEVLDLMNKGVSPEDDAMMEIIERYYGMGEDCSMIYIDPEMMRIRRTNATEFWKCIEAYMQRAAECYISKRKREGTEEKSK